MTTTETKTPANRHRRGRHYPVHGPLPARAHFDPRDLLPVAALSPDDAAALPVEWPSWPPRVQAIAVLRGLGWSQQDCANVLQVTRQAVQDVGRRYRLDGFVLQPALARALSLSLWTRLESHALVGLTRAQIEETHPDRRVRIAAEARQVLDRQERIQADARRPDPQACLQRLAAALLPPQPALPAGEPAQATTAPKPAKV